MENGAAPGGTPGATRLPGPRYLLLSLGGGTGSGGKYRVALGRRVTPGVPPPSIAARARALLARSLVARGSRGGWVTRRATSVHATPPRML